MDIRVVDWSTEDSIRVPARTWRSLRASFARVVASSLVVWLALAGLQKALPFVENGGGAVGDAKYEIAVRPGLFAPHDKLRVYAFGNSKILAGFRPDVFARACGPDASAFNLAIPGREKFVDVLEAALKAGNVPNHILLQFFPTQSPEDSLLGAVQDNKKIVRFLFPFRSFVRDAISFVFEARGPSGFVRQYRSNAAQVEQVRLDRGYYFIKSQSLYPGDQLPADYRLPTDHPNQILGRPVDVGDPEFLRLIDLASEYDFRIDLIPVAFRMGEYAPPPAESPETIAAVRRFERVKIAGPPYLLYEPAAFSDPVHLNPSGAEKYTIDVASRLCLEADEVRRNAL